MTTAYATNDTMDSTVVGAVGALGGLDIDSSESRHLALPSPLALDGRRASDSTLASPQPSPRTALPPPNPPFVFPSRGLPSSAPSSFSRASGQRPRSAIDLHQKTFDLSGVPADTGSWGRSTRRSPALPDFSFNPGSSLSPNSAATSRSPRSPSFDFSFHPSSSLSASENAPSPPVSPGQPTPNRGGHKRGGSEFVGGHIRNGNSITVTNISPTKSESGLATPTLAPVDSSTAQRRGRHAHRRSAAISSHDLSMILKPASPNISGDSSAPSTPAHVEENAKATNDSAATDETKSASAEPADSADINGGASDKQLAAAPELFTEKSTPRARVGFSDNVEFIPRPLSLVSTDTTSTVTARPGHSVSNSISSIISMSNSITQEREQVSLRTSPQYGAASESKVDSRPSTAGAVLDRTPSLHALAVAESSTSPRRRNSIPLLNNLTVADPDMPAVPSPSKTPKRWSFFGLESLGLAGSPTKPRPHSSSSAETAPKHSSMTASSTENIITEGANDLISTQPDLKKLAGKKHKKKVKAWAGSILTRKTKPRLKSKSGRRHSMTPPPPPKLDLSDDEDEDMADVTSQPATAPTVMVTGPAADPAFADSSFKAEDDPSFPMIDLDAALGPFNTPSSLDPAWEAAQRAGAPPKRQLHSAAGLRGFSGPGMHYHRRTESAPEMPPFEGARFGIHRFGSSSTMADVFEEEEEDDDDSGSDESTPDASGASIADADVHSASDDASTPTQEVEASLKSSNDSASVTPSVERKGSGSSLEMLPIPSRLRSDTSSNSLHDDIIAEEAPVHNAADQERIYETTFGSSDSAAPSPRRILTSKDSGSSDVNSMRLPAPLLTPLSPFSMSHSSMASPPLADVFRWAPCLHSTLSLLMGEPGPEVVRISIDVPSLTSSNSTMTRESNFPGVRPRSTPFHDQRPASFTSSAFGRRRSSLASLSRLINSAHGERSKLSMEVPADNEPDKKQKSSKTKRLSKMMQFWKPKESTRA
ncbi:hypothetical protein PG997_004689 [Apiospora hydei]|uniref:Cell wall proline rich protein n=1 Tax=Apiospora hydei TaxID=1337664 RepID=A0ABR1X2S6_9PEZI